MVKTQSSFDYDNFDAATQAFLQQKTIEIKLLSESLNSMSNQLVLKAAYAIGEKLVEVSDASSESCKPYFEAWLTNEIIKELNNRKRTSFYNYIYLYKYTSEYLGGVAGLEGNPKISQSALYTLGLPGTSDEIKQKFAEIAKTGKTIRKSDVDQATREKHIAKVKSVDTDLNFGSGNYLEDEIQNSSIDVIWLGKNKSIKAAFEIECTTSIYSGLLRMTDLMELHGSLNFSFYIVIPEARVKEVKQQLSRPTFKAIELDKKCKWIIIEELDKKWKEMMEWSTVQP